MIVAALRIELVRLLAVSAPVKAEAWATLSARPLHRAWQLARANLLRQPLSRLVIVGHSADELPNNGREGFANVRENETSRQALRGGSVTSSEQQQVRNFRTAGVDATAKLAVKRSSPQVRQKFAADRAANGFRKRVDDGDISEVPKLRCGRRASFCLPELAQSPSTFL